MSTGLPVEVERQRAPDVGAPTGTPGDRPMSLCPLAAVKGGGSNLGCEDDGMSMFLKKSLNA